MGIPDMEMAGTLTNKGGSVHVRPRLFWRGHGEDGSGVKTGKS